MKAITFLFFLMIACRVPCAAIIWKGKLLDKTSGQVIQGAHILNLNSNFSVISDGKGEFDIPATVGDLIQFSCPGYATETHTVLKGLENIRLKFSLKFKSYELNEVTIKKQYKTIYQRDSAERSVLYHATLSRSKSGLSSPVSFFAEKFSKKQKSLFSFKKLFYQLEKEQFVASLYHLDMLKDLVPLRGDTLAYFKNNYPMDYDFARNATSLELKMWVKYNYKQFLMATDSLKQLHLDVPLIKHQ